MAEKLNVAVLFGGRSGEHEVSLMSARSIISAMDEQKYRPIEIGITHNGKWFSGPNTLKVFEGGSTTGLESVSLIPEPGEASLFRLVEGQPVTRLEKIDVVFPVLHGSYGEDGTVQGLLELANLPYVGAGVLASSVAMDKGLFKQLMAAEGIPMIDFTVLLSSQIEQDSEDALRLAEQVGPYPLFTKPANLGSSVGITKCRNRSDLLEGLMEAVRFDRRVVVEMGINAREIEVSVLGNEDPRASIPGEIIPSDDFYSYRAKYIDDASKQLIPAPLDESTSEMARQIAIQSYRTIDCAGMARVDFFLDKETNRLYLNEINTIPGFTKISMYPKLWEATGISYNELVERLIQLALQRHAQVARLVRRYEGDT